MKASQKKLVSEAYANSLAKVKNPKDLVQGKTIVKSVSEKKRAEKKTKVIKPSSK